MKLILFFSLLLIFPLQGWCASSQGIRDEISEGIDKLENLGSHEISIDVRLGNVTLDGTVASQEDRERIVELVKGIDGVDFVEDNLIIKVRSSGKTSDLALAVKDAVSKFSEKSSYQIQINVTGSGIITLAGDVFNENDKKLIEDEIRKVPGVNDVKNSLTIIEPDDETLGKVVQIQIESSPTIVIKDLVVRSENGTVILSGVARSHRDLDEALSIVLNVPGVRDVKSEIKFR